MNAPDWLNNTLRTFGRQLGLQNFSLNDRNAAELHFENGTTLAFEYVRQALVISARLPMPAEEEALKRLLSLAHPGTGSLHVRAYYLQRTGEGACSAVLSENSIEVNTIEAVFQELWKRMEYLRRNSTWR